MVTAKNNFQFLQHNAVCMDMNEACTSKTLRLEVYRCKALIRSKTLFTRP